MRPKRVLFIDHDMVKSGATISLKYITDSFQLNNFDVFLLTRKSEKDCEIFTKSDVNIIKYSNSALKSIALSIHFSDDYPFLSKNWFLTIFKNIFRTFVGIITIWRVVKKTKPDLIYLNEHNLLCGALVARILGVPSFMHIRSKFIEGKFHIRESIIAKSILKFNNYVFTISQIEFNQLKRYSMGKNNFDILPEFLAEKDFELFNSDEVREELSLPKEKKIVLSFGGIDKLKGTLDYINSIHILNIKENNVFFLLAGEIKSTGLIKEVNEYYLKTIEMLQKIEQDKNFRMLGFVEAPQKLISAVDVLVSPLTSSHFSRPIIESWALKKAIITSDTEHSRSYIVDGFDGLFYTIGNADQLSNKILELTSDDSLYQKLSLNGYEKAKNYYLKESNPLKIVNKFNTLFSNAVNNYY